MIKRVLNKKGFSAPWAVVVALASFMLFTALWQMSRLIITATGVKQALQSAVISTATENYGNVYTGIRDGYAGGYTLSYNVWKQSISRGNVYGNLDSLLGLTKKGTKHIKYGDDGIEYSVYSLRVSVDNAPFAPSDADGIPQLTVTSEIMLEVPLSFCGDTLPPMKVKLQVKSKYVPKF